MVEQSVTATVTLSFWGATVEVACTPADALDVEFFYGAYLTPSTDDPDISVTIECTTWPTRGFFTSSLARDLLEKRITVEDHRDPSRSAQRTYRDWSDLVSPFPPFASAALTARTATFPGALVRSQDGDVTAIIGEHYVGKTSTALAWCRDHGAALISDSLIVLDVPAGVALTFESPLGFRRQGLEEIIPTLDTIDHRLTVSEDTGLVALVRPEDVLGVRNSAGGPIDHFVLLTETDELSASWSSVAPRRLGWFTGADPDSIAALLPEAVLHVSTPKASTPTQRAAIIADAIRQEKRA
ncbi:hypothetical protein [Curtobacterium sp. MCLR17_040]|uniref:hypothetical protein n=1 Tax=Curtobacterium sp. MCLR17_040 TaxID=2175625 RepID=UPI0015E8C030|nr:hypothetical protein [Curtobacterium sp. MCLR17_040]